jgi:hypothetical protein
MSLGTQWLNGICFHLVLVLLPAPAQRHFRHMSKSRVLDSMFNSKHFALTVRSTEADASTSLLHVSQVGITGCLVDAFARYG